MPDTRHLRSYGRIKARTLKPRQAGLVETLLPHLAVPETGAIDIEALFPSPWGEGPGVGVNASPVGVNASSPGGATPHPPIPSPSRGGVVILEIGFGGGEHLVAQAVAHPEARFIGVEPFLNGVASCLRHIEEAFLRGNPLPLEGGGVGVSKLSVGLSRPPGAEPAIQTHLVRNNSNAERPGITPPPAPSPSRGGGALPNIRLHQGDARDVIARLPDACLDLVYILFPDPWPKTRHHKRRLIQPEFLDELARVLKPGAEVRFATDWANYAAWTLEIFTHDPRFTWLAERAEDWRAPWPGHVTTRYEAKKLGDCAPVWLRFVRE